MAKKIKVTAACVVVNVAGNERYVYRGSMLPIGVDRADVTRLRNNGLVAEVDVDDSKPKAEESESEREDQADQSKAADTDGEKPEEAAPAAKTSGRSTAAKK